MGGHSSTTTQGAIDPTLIPLFQGSSNQLLNYQGQNPLTGYGGSNPMDVANMSPAEQYALSQSYGLGQADPMMALAMQGIMNMPTYAMAGPTTGQANPYDIPTGAYMDMFQSPYGPYNGAEGGGSYSPESLGPDVNSSYQYQGPHTGPNYGPNAPPDQGDGPSPQGWGYGQGGAQLDPRSAQAFGSPAPFSMPTGRGWRDDPRLNWAAAGNQITPGSWQGGYGPNGEPLLAQANLVGGPQSNVEVSGTHAFSGAQLGPSGLDQGQYNQLLNEDERARLANQRGLGQNASWNDIYANSAQQRQQAMSDPRLAQMMSGNWGAVQAGAQQAQPTPQAQPQTAQLNPQREVAGATYHPGQQTQQTQTPQAGGRGPVVTVPPRGGPVTVPPRPTQPPFPNQGPQPGQNPTDPGNNPPPRQPTPQGQLQGGPSEASWRALNQLPPPSTTGATPFGQSPGIQAGYAHENGANIAGDPAIAAALANFNQQVAPGIQNSAALAGLGNSSAMTNALAQAQGSMLEPLYENAFARQQHVQDRGYGATEEELARRERSSVRGSEAQQNAIDRLMALSQMNNNRQQGGVQALMQGGGVQRGIEQQGNESAYNDFLRRQALSESATYQSFGGMLPSAFGSRQTSTGK